MRYTKFILFGFFGLLVSCGLFRQKQVKIHGLFDNNGGFDKNHFWVRLDSTGWYVICHYKNSNLLLLHKGKYKADTSNLVLKGFGARKYRKWRSSKDSLVLKEKDLSVNSYKLKLWNIPERRPRKDTVRFTVKRFKYRSKKHQHIYDFLKKQRG